MKIEIELDQIEKAELALGVKIPRPKKLDEPKIPFAHDMVRIEDFGSLGGTRERFTKVTNNGLVTGVFFQMEYAIWKNNENNREVVVGRIYFV